MKKGLDKRYYSVNPNGGVVHKWIEEVGWFPVDKELKITFNLSDMWIVPDETDISKGIGSLREKGAKR